MVVRADAGSWVRIYTDMKFGTISIGHGVYPLTAMAVIFSNLSLCLLPVA